MLSLASLMISIVFLIILIFVMVNFEQIIKKLRKVCEEPSGYFKLGQLILLMFSTLSFSSLLIYNIFKERQTSATDIFLTVIVGILGTIVGFFFGSKAEQHTTEPRKQAIEKNISAKEKAKGIIQELIKKIN